MARAATTRTIRRDQVPTAFSNVQAWYLGNGAHIQNGKVDFWSDASGQGNHLLQATAANRFTLTEADSSYNNMPTMSTGATGFMSTGTWGTPLAQPATWYIVGNSGATDNYRGFAGDTTVSTKMSVSADITTGLIKVFSPTELFSAVAGGTKHIICAVFNGASSSIYVNNMTTASVTGNPGANGLVQLSVGSIAAGADPLNGTLAEIAIFSGAHDLNTRGLIANYLGTKFTVTVT